MIRLKKYYENIIYNDLAIKFNYLNHMQIPNLIKIIIHLTIKESVKDQNAIYIGLFVIELIGDQKGKITKIKNSVSFYKIQKNMNIGCKVTLRKLKMYFFLDKLIFITISKIKFFENLTRLAPVNSSIYTFGLSSIDCFVGIKELLFHGFLNLNVKIGCQIHFMTNTQLYSELYFLLKCFLFPIK